jgi:putative transposase
MPCRGNYVEMPPDLGEPQATAAAANVLNRNFDAAAPNRKWIADFTDVWAGEGWLYVAAAVDLFSRRVVGWSMNAAMTAELVTDALVMAIWRRGKRVASRIFRTFDHATASVSDRSC